MSRQLDYGRHGSDLIVDTTTVAGAWNVIAILEATVFSVLSVVQSTDLTITSGGLAAATFPAGLEIRGNFTSIRLASGAVLAYDSQATSQ